MSRKNIALAFVVLLAGLVVFLALTSSQAPVLPADPEHAGFVNLNGCMGDCHGPDGIYPQEKNHPLRTDCLDCHGMPK